MGKGSMGSYIHQGERGLRVRSGEHTMCLPSMAGGQIQPEHVIKAFGLCRVLDGLIIMKL